MIQKKADRHEVCLLKHSKQRTYFIIFLTRSRGCATMITGFKTKGVEGYADHKRSNLSVYAVASVP